MSTEHPQKRFDNTIGRLDRLLSEFLLLHQPALDEANRQTLKHHADDLIGVGQRMHQLLLGPPSPVMPPPSSDRPNQGTQLGKTGPCETTDR